jgi:hypothetical protein
VFGHAALQARVTAGVFARTQSSVAGHLTPIIKPAPIANLPINDYAGHFTQAARLIGSGSTLQLHCESSDLFL